MIDDFEKQVFEGRFSLPFVEVVYAIGHVLGQCVRRTGGRFQYQPAERPPLTYYTLTADGIAGYEIIVGTETPGLPGMDYYARPTATERHLWRDIGNALYEWTETELKNLVILELVARPGGDASGLLKSPHEAQTQFDRASAALLAWYDKGRSTRRGGRPSDPDNDWAREQVQDLGRPSGDVYPEWLKRIGTRAQMLDDPRDSFKKAIKPKKEKKGK